MTVSAIEQTACWIATIKPLRQFSFKGYANRLARFAYIEFPEAPLGKELDDNPPPVRFQSEL